MKITTKADAICILQGSRDYPQLKGVVLMHQREQGVLLKVSIKGYPVPRRIQCNQPIIAIHIHEGKSCSGNQKEPFADAKGHYNPHRCPHPYHAGDLGNLMINKNGTAYMCMINDRFSVEEVIGRVMILHQSFDDFTTQPSGNSKTMIACGVISKTHHST